MWQVASGRRRRRPGTGSTAGGAPRSAGGLEGSLLHSSAGQGGSPVSGPEAEEAAQRAEARVRARAAALRGSAILQATEEGVREVWAAAVAIVSPSVAARAHSTDVSSPVAAAASVEACVEDRTGTAACTEASIEDRSGGAAGTETSAQDQSGRAVGTEASVEDPSETSVEDRSGRLLCLGIGSVESSVPSANQLAMAWLLAEALGIRQRAWADPQMHPADITAGKALGFRAMPPAAALAELGTAGAAQEPLLLYMPHCDRALYEQVLAACLSHADAGAQGGNLSAQASLPVAREVPALLNSVALVGNSFELYASRDEQGVVPAGTPGAAVAGSLMRELRPITHERVLPEYGTCPEAFNDLAVISFSL